MDKFDAFLGRVLNYLAGMGILVTILAIIALTT